MGGTDNEDDCWEHASSSKRSRGQIQSSATAREVQTLDYANQPVPEIWRPGGAGSATALQRLKDAAKQLEVFTGSVAEQLQQVCRRGQRCPPPRSTAPLIAPIALLQDGLSRVGPLHKKALADEAYAKVPLDKAAAAKEVADIRRGARDGAATRR
jgi:hypothetical protein